MLTTDFLPGAPNWLDLGARDTTAAAAFYTAAFGWRFESAGPDAGGYGFFKNDGKIVAALGPLTEEGATSAWTVYFNTADADATVKKAEQAGGAVRVPPGDVFTAGRAAALTDPAGAEFALWQPRDRKGLDQVTDPGSLSWLELYVPDPGVVRAFYEATFDWRVTDVPFNDITYTVIATAEGADADLAGVMTGEPAHWLPYFEVSDSDATWAAAIAAGASAILELTTSPDVGRFAVLTDPEGARFGIITSACDAPF